MKKLLLIIIAVFLFSTVEAGPFEPKARTYRHSTYKKSKPFKKDAFVCTRTKKLNRHGLMR